MKKVLCMAACAVLVAGVSANAESLDLRIYTDGPVSIVTVVSGTSVPVYIDADLGEEDSTLGLGLIGLDAIGGGTALGGKLALAEPANGDMDSFVKNDGLTNPDGYGGTADGDDLLQIGGGQNTINNDVGHAPYPIGSVSLNVGNAAHASGAPIVIADGTFDTTGLADGVYTITIDNAFANTIDGGQAGPVYDVTPIDSGDISYSMQVLTVVVGAAADPPEFTDIDSMGYHGSPVNGDLPVSINPAGTIAGADVVEPRQFTVGGLADLNVQATFDKAISTVAITVTEQGGVATLDVTTTIASNVVDIDYITTPANGTCYVFDMTGTQASDGGVMDGTVDYDFCICYLEADIDRGGLVAGLDGAKVSAGSNWGLAANVAADGPMVDIDRSGLVAGLDGSRVSAGANWNNSPSNSCP